MDFHQALNTVHAELTPQPWDFITHDGITLTVIPEGLPTYPGGAKVTIRVTASHADAVEVGIRTTDLPALIEALGAPVTRSWQHIPHWPDGTVEWTPEGLGLTPNGDGFLIGIVEHVGDWFVRCADVVIPEAQRLPLASALRRAADVATGWES